MLLPAPLTRAVEQALRAAPSRHAPLVIASMGRSGSTLVFEAVCEAMGQARFGRIETIRRIGAPIAWETAWNLSDTRFRRGRVYKTHGLADELPRNTGVKVVFLFGAASEAALSVVACRERYGDAWIREHFEHLRADGAFEDLGHRDVLRFRDQLDGWFGLTGVPRLLIHYDALWENADVLSRFCGVPVRLPERRAREGAQSVPPEVRAQFEQTYAALDARIAALPRCQVLE